MPTVARPPSIDPLVALADRCVQCGLCLPACPTYGHDQLEAESPRGRIALMRAWALETVEATPTGDAHLDHCLSCRSCEAVCPAGVKYDDLLVLARERQHQRRRSGLRQRAAEALTARPRLLARLLGLYRHTYHLLPRAWRPLPRPPATDASRLSTATTAPMHTVALFVGCVAGPYETAVRAALARLCVAMQVDVVVPSTQTCCGTLHAHTGDRECTQRLGATNRDAFAGADTVLTLASGCHDTLAQSLPGRAAILDALIFVDTHGQHLRFREHRERIALHLPCTQRNVVKSVPALRRLLARVPGLEVIELDAGYGCCGAAGTQMWTDPGRANSYREPLLVQLASSGASRLLSANIGCRLHLANGTELPVQHPIEFLADLLAPAPAPRTAAP
jgi:glycolate oxidase iron-sulfur subunit